MMVNGTPMKALRLFQDGRKERPREKEGGEKTADKNN